MLLGGFLWGSLGDIYGRRATLIVAMLVNTVFGAVSAVSGDYATFLVLRFISGLGYDLLHKTHFALLAFAFK